MELVIMAAGLGSRFGGLKQLEPIDKNGNFIIDYSIFDAIRCGFDKVVFIIKPENFEAFRNTIGKRIEKYIETNYIFQTYDNVPKEYQIPSSRKKPLGTGHAILCAKGTIHSNFVTINADDFYGYDALRCMADFIKRTNCENQSAVAGYEVANTCNSDGEVKRGLCGYVGNKLKTIVDYSIKKWIGDKYLATSLDGKNTLYIEPDQLVSMNLFAFSPKFFDYLDVHFIEFLNKNKDNLESAEFFLPHTVTALIEEGRLNVDIIKTSAKWQGMTFKEDKVLVENYIQELVKQGVYPDNLWGDSSKM